MGRFTILAVLTIALAAPTFAQDAADSSDKVEKIRNNRVSYGMFRTGQDAETFGAGLPGFKQGEPMKWAEFSDEFKKAAIWAPSPKGYYVPKLAAKHMPVMLSTNKEECDQASKALFATDADGVSSLYAYEFHLCDESGLLTTGGLVDQYVQEYGMYDEKIYDRNMILYNNVQSRWRVGVSPWTTPDKNAGVTITVVDDLIFKETIRSWRVHLKREYDTARSRF